MASSTQPAAELSHLPKADGSATFSYGGYSVIAAVNGPVEAQRRDENAFEALVDVIVRPAAGVGGTRERQLESILQAALRQLIPVRNYPRCVIQTTIQVVETPDNAYVNAKLVQASLNLPIIPALLHAAILAILTAAIPLKTIATATVIAISDGDTKFIVDPTAVEADRARSLHVLGFASQDELLVSESEGSFSADEWTKVLELGQRICSQRRPAGMDTVMAGDNHESQSMKEFIRLVVEAKTAEDLHWK
ncbi:ribosomal protein S5 domain 2-type protein [Dactylonectria macrodidyma]|uniref:Ribosomal protein S5 domain 2-type protein n=1 Tax=Dactylonectria macrodidyma TaxID=307937 RepID=A0A9P9JM54_9HYPO|nr:ribosomal protein S5 domain 2-type protein [Dactylonectria macrodidyma]